MREKEVNARIVARNVYQRENIVPGGKIDLVAFADESHSFYFKDMVYLVTFDLGTRSREFQVEKRVFDACKEGEQGKLIYRGDKFISFQH